VRLSTLADNFFCLHVPNEHDYLLVSPAKTEIVQALARAVNNALGGALRITYADRCASQAQRRP
jgi:hypothetical protein